MADPLFSHQLFDIFEILKAASGGLGDFLREGLFQELNEAQILHAAVEDPDNPGGFIPSKNFITSVLQRGLNDAPGPLPPVDEMSTADLVDGLKLIPGTVIPQIPQDVQSATSRTSDVLSELLARSNDSASQKAFIKEAFALKRGVDRDFRGSSSQGIAAAARVPACALAEAIGDPQAARRRLDSNARRNVRSCTRSPQDGRRVSREPHEYRYCFFESEQWQDMLNFVENGTGAVVLQASTNAADYTFGNFVDAKLARKFIARMRKVRRFAFSANVKAVLSSLGGGDQRQFFQTLMGDIPSGEYDAIATELNELNN